MRDFKAGEVLLSGGQGETCVISVFSMKCSYQADISIQSSLGYLKCSAVCAKLEKERACWYPCGICTLVSLHDWARRLDQTDVLLTTNPI